MQVILELQIIKIAQQTEQTNKLANKIVNKQTMKQVTMQTSIQVQTNIKTICLKHQVENLFKQTKWQT